MKLLKLSLRNFKGIRDFTLEANGNNVDIYGNNGTGKTTLVDAFMWLLFSKDSQNRTNFEIKTLDESGQPIHGLEHEVEAILELENGRYIALKKIYKEVWTKKRGSATKEFTGHTIEHFVDGVPVKKNEYQRVISEIVDENIFRLLTDPTYFNEHLHWQNRRRLLLEVAGDVTDEEVIASNQELASLKEILAGRSLDDHRKVIMARRKEINSELERIPVRIDEVMRNLPEATDNDKTTLEQKLKELRDCRTVKQQELVRLQNGGQVAELKKYLSEIESEMINLQNKARIAVDQAVQAERTKLAELHSKIDAKKQEIQRFKNELANSEATINELQPRIEALRQDWYKVYNEQPDLSVDEVCPVCGQPLPTEQIQEAREKAIAEFNIKKSKRLEEIQSEGKRLRARVDELKKQKEKAVSAIKQAEQELLTLETKAAEVEERIRQLVAETPDITKMSEYIKLLEKKKQIEEQIKTIEAGNLGVLDKIAGEISNLDAEIASIESAISRIEQREHGLKRIEELKAEERQLAAEYEELEHQLYLTEQFIRTKVRLLEDKINSRFKLARFKLFNTLVNGGIEETCETMLEGVPYGNLNHGAKLNVGLDIINVLAEHYSFAPPVWIDNAESVTEILPTKGQQIKLIVSASDKTLRVEKSKNFEEVI